MNHHEYASEFKSLADRINELAEETSQDSYEFYCKLRSCAEEGGRLLYDAIRNNLLNPLFSDAPWLRYTLFPDNTILFKSIQIEDEVSITGSPLNLDKAVQSMAMIQRERLKDKSNITKKDVKRFINRHIFLEAANDWLHTLFSDELDSFLDLLNISEWVTKPEQGTEIIFVTDCVPQDRRSWKQKEKIPNAATLTQLYKRTCEVLAKYIEKYTRLTPDEISEGFHDSYKDFENIYNKYRGMNNSLKSLLSEINYVASQSGYLLISGLKTNQIKAPENPPPWLRYFMNISQTRFIEGSLSYAVSFQNDPPVYFGALYQALLSCKSPMDDLEISGESSAEKMDFLHRHIFIEAAATWLKERYSHIISSIPLPKLEVIADSGEADYFISTWFDEKNADDDVHLLVSLAKVCRNVCNILSRSTKYNDIKGKRSQKKKDNKNHISKQSEPSESHEESGSASSKKPSVKKKVYEIKARPDDCYGTIADDGIKITQKRVNSTVVPLDRRLVMILKEAQKSVYDSAMAATRSSGESREKIEEIHELLNTQGKPLTITHDSIYQALDKPARKKSQNTQDISQLRKSVNFIINSKDQSDVINLIGPYDKERQHWKTTIVFRFNCSSDMDLPYSPNSKSYKGG